MDGRPPALWSYGIITVPERAELLANTRRSLAQAGFPDPLLFADAAEPTERLGVVGNWVNALWRLYVRCPVADFYAVFQDDILAVTGLREYLSATCRQPQVYWNLYTYMNNEEVTRTAPVGTWHESAIRSGRDKANPRPDPGRRQTGLGALGLVFKRDGVQTLLTSPILIDRPAAADPLRSKKNLDGAVVEAMNAAGYRELVHQPTLLCHTGKFSTLERGKEWASFARSWTGEATDARDWLPT